jgi:hypothetical protein
LPLFEVHAPPPKPVIHHVQQLARVRYAPIANQIPQRSGMMRCAISDFELNAGLKKPFVGSG